MVPLCPVQRPTTTSPTACRDRSFPAPIYAPEENDRFHDPCSDVSEARYPSRAQREVIDLLCLAPTAALVRLSLADWRRVDHVVDALAQARTPPAVIPRPRPEAGGQDGGTADVRQLAGKVAGAGVNAA